LAALLASGLGRRYAAAAVAAGGADPTGVEPPRETPHPTTVALLRKLGGTE